MDAECIEEQREMKVLPLRRSCVSIEDVMLVKKEARDLRRTVCRHVSRDLEKLCARLMERKRKTKKDRSRCSRVYLLLSGEMSRRGKNTLGKHVKSVFLGHFNQQQKDRV